MKSIHSLFSLILILGLVSCNDSDRDTDSTTEASSSVVLAQNYFNDIFKSAHQVIVQDSILTPQNANDGLPACIDSIIVSPQVIGSYPKTVWIFFNGVVNCNRIKNGLVQIDLTAPYLDSLSQASFTFYDLKVNGYTISGIINQEYRGKVNGTRTFTRKIENGKITRNGLGNKAIEILHDENSSIQWTGGFVTDTIGLDDEFTYSSTFNGRHSFGKFYSGTTIQPVQMDMNCKWERNGQLKLVIEPLADRIITYNTVCSPTASILINGGSKSIGIPE